MHLFSRITFLLPLLFAPLAFGTVEFWSRYTLEILVVLAFLSTVISLKVNDEPWLKVPGLTPLLLMLLLMAVQVVPLPPELVKTLSPASWQAYSPLFDTGWNGDISLSINRQKTVEEFFRYGAYTLFYIVTVQQLRSGNRIKPVLLTLVYFATGIAVLAIIQKFTSHGLIYWFRRSPSGTPGGPWININQYAAFVEAICPLALALFLLYRPRGLNYTLRQRIVTFFSSPRSNRYLLLGLCFVILFGSVCVTLCRGGILTLFVSVLLFAWLQGQFRQGSSRKAIFIAMGIGLVAAGWFGWEHVLNEFAKAIDTEGHLSDARLDIWRDTLQIIKDFPVFGGGFGSYMDLNPSYRTIVAANMVDHAHNDYLELLTDGGAIGFALAAWFVLSIISNGWRWLKQRRDTYAQMTGIGALTAICAMLMHCIVDFNLHNGADGLYFFFLCALVVAITHARFQKKEVASMLEESSRGGLLGGCLVALLYTVLLVPVQTGSLMAAAEFAPVRNIYVNPHLNVEKQQRIRTATQEAARLAPFESFYPAYLGWMESNVGNREAATITIQNAIARQPMAGHNLHRLALLLPPEQQQEAVHLMAEGSKRALNKLALVQSRTEWLLANDNREAAKEVLRTHFENYPYQVKANAPLLYRWHFSKAELENILPHRVTPWLQYAAWLNKLGNTEDAAYCYNRAFQELDSEEHVRSWWFHHLYSFYNRQKQPETAMDVVRKGVKILPEHPQFYYWLGVDEEKKENLKTAVRYYRKAVLLAPKHKGFARKLKATEKKLKQTGA